MALHFPGHRMKHSSYTQRYSNRVATFFSGKAEMVAFTQIPHPWNVSMFPKNPHRAS